MWVKVIIVFKSTQSLESTQIILDTLSSLADSLPWQVEFDYLEPITLLYLYRLCIIKYLLTVVLPCHFINACLASHSPYRIWRVLTLNSTILLYGLGECYTYNTIENCIVASYIVFHITITKSK